MQVDIYKDQQNILYVCPSKYWGTRERMALKDIKIARDVGHNVFLYCLRDSSLHEHAKRENIHCFFHQGKNRIKFRHWYRLGELRSIIKKFDVNIVHCYNLNYLWPLSYFLRKEKYKSLVLTLNRDLKSFYLNFYFRPLVSRIDLVFLPMKEMLESVRGHLNIPPMKMEFIGLGLKVDRTVELEKSKEFWDIGLFVGGHEEDASNIMPVLRCLNSLVHGPFSERNFKLHLLSDKKWMEFVIFSEVDKFITENNLEDHVEFQRADSVEEYQKNLHLWIAVNPSEALEDYTMTALVNKVPVITPRNPSSMEMIRQLGRVGKTYKSGDARELKNCCVEVLSKSNQYCQNLTFVREQIERMFGGKTYKNQILSLYEKSLNKRLRLYPVKR